MNALAVMDRIGDRVVAVVAAAAAPVDALLIHEHVFSSETGGLVGAVVTALVAGYHGGAVVARRASRPTPGGRHS